MSDLSALLLEESDAPAVLAAMSGALEPTASSPETFTLLGELALAGYDGQRAQGYAQRALQLDPKDLAALRVLARAYVMRGDAPQAVATARRAQADDATRGGFELAEILAALQEWAVRHGRAPNACEWLTGSPDRPGSLCVRRRFGSWTRALKRAGLKPNARRQFRYWTDDEILVALKAWARHRGRLLVH